MGRKAVWGVAAFAVMLALPAATSAQVQTLKDHQIADAKQMSEKFLGLAEKFTEEQYDWRPMEGVRSVREVFAHVTAEAKLFPSIWGVTPPPGIAGGFLAEQDRLAELDKADIIAELNGAFAYFAESLEGMSDADRMADGNTFGTAMKNEAGITLAMTDMHEHLGQLIAYARTNHVVPPWSEGN